MSNALLCPTLRQRFFDLNGVPLAGGQLFSYTAGTSTPQATYADITEATPNTNPIVLDSAGYANVWLGAGVYKFVLEDALGNFIWSVDQVSAASNGSNIGTPISASILDNQSSFQNIIGMSVNSAVNQCMVMEYTIIRSNGSTVKRREHGYLYLTYDSVNGWILNRSSQGADALNLGISLQITTGGAIQYKSDSMGGIYAGQITWQVVSAFATEGI
jgi:hypothetical protein